ncbi:MAG: hypothetical protein IPQ18_07020 [Saprospiraceae bacterium]|nr:hypothetical protein [Saprospiraceae bacterium]
MENPALARPSASTTNSNRIHRRQTKSSNGVFTFQGIDFCGNNDERISYPTHRSLGKKNRHQSPIVTPLTSAKNPTAFITFKSAKRNHSPNH